MPILISQPTQVKAAGNKPKIIQEFIGGMNSKTTDISIARMQSPGGWVQYSTPQADGAEYIAVCRPTFSLDIVHRDE